MYITNKKYLLNVLAMRHLKGKKMQFIKIINILQFYSSIFCFDKHNYK